ncbi:MAG: hypothetical protein WC966_06590 [Bradymonadales bacterium]
MMKNFVFASSLALFLLPGMSMAQEQNSDTEATSQILLDYSQELIDSVQKNKGNCEQMASAMIAIHENYKSKLESLAYSSQRASDKDAALLMQRAEALGKEAAQCYQHAAVEEILSTWIKTR